MYSKNAYTCNLTYSLIMTQIRNFAVGKGRRENLENCEYLGQNQGYAPAESQFEFPVSTNKVHQEVSFEAPYLMKLPGSEFRALKKVQIFSALLPTTFSSLWMIKTSALL